MDIGIVRPVRIDEEMKGAYLDYAMSVITARALPDVRDGLKPVQRRILYSMDELGLRHSAAYKKSARIVGEVMGKYHPHGDAPVYEAMVRMAQEFSMRYPLVDGQGNFGSVDGDPPAAMRYTEARLASIAEEMLADIDKNTVDFSPNFDDTLKEPKVLPAKVPNLLVNGSSGIAVGMATNIPPHNLTEVASAVVYVIERFGEALDGGVPFSVVWNRAFSTAVDMALVTAALPQLKPAVKQRLDAAMGQGAGGSAEQRAQALLGVVDDIIDVPPDKLMEIVKGPDFPTAGIILGVEGIKNAFATGHGRITIRARVHTEEMRAGRTQIVVTELPFQVNKATLQEKIAELVRERRIDGISELRDESDRDGMRLVIELRREAQPKQILNQLYKYTSMQTAFSVNMLALVDGQPRVLTLKMALLHYLNHRREVITRRTQFELEKARHRAHILEGLKIALDNLDEVIATIRRSKDAETARTALMKGFKLTEIQAQAILDMQLRRLAALERQKIRDELAEVLKVIAHLEDLLAHPTKILYLIKDELVELKTKYGDERKTRIISEELADFTEEDLIPDQEVMVALSVKGYVKRMASDYVRVQRRTTKGIVGTITKEDDPPVTLVDASLQDSLLVFSNRGRAYQIKVWDLPDASRQQRGAPISNFVALEEQEQVVSLLPMRQVESRHVVLATRQGEVKRVSASDYSSARASGIIGMLVPEGDELVAAVATSGRQDVILTTAQGQAIRFLASELRTSGRASGGVRGIKLGAKDLVVSLDVARAGGYLVVVTRQGYGKRTVLDEFSTQGRGGGGIKAVAVGAKNGVVVAGRVASEADEIIVVTSGGTVLRSPISAMHIIGRATQGVPVVRLGRDQYVISATLLRAPDKTGGGKRGPSGGPQTGKNGADKTASNGMPGAEASGKLPQLQGEGGQVEASANGRKRAAARQGQAKKAVDEREQPALSAEVAPVKSGRRATTIVGRPDRPVLDKLVGLAATRAPELAATSGGKGGSEAKTGPAVKRGGREAAATRTAIVKSGLAGVLTAQAASGAERMSIGIAPPAPKGKTAESVKGASRSVAGALAQKVPSVAEQKGVGIAPPAPEGKTEGSVKGRSRADASALAPSAASSEERKSVGIALPALKGKPDGSVKARAVASALAPKAAPAADWRSVGSTPPVAKGKTEGSLKDASATATTTTTHTKSGGAASGGSMGTGMEKLAPAAMSAAGSVTMPEATGTRAKEGELVAKGKGKASAGKPDGKTATKPTTLFGSIAQTLSAGVKKTNSANSKAAKGQAVKDASAGKPQAKATK